MSSIKVKVKTRLQQKSAYDPKNVFGVLSKVRFRIVEYNWDDPRPDVVTWEHFLEAELAKEFQKQHIPWPNVIRCQCEHNMRSKEVKMAISLKSQFLVGMLSWK